MTIDSRIFVSSSANGSVIDTGTGNRYYDIDRLQIAAYGGADSFLKDNFTWLHYHIYEPITASSNMIGFPLSIDWSNINNGAYNRSIIDGFYSVAVSAIQQKFTYLNTILNLRNGPYQYPMWKQIRNEDNPIVKDQRNNNIISILDSAEEVTIIQDGTIRIVKPTRGNSILYYDEPCIVNKYFPLIHVIDVGTELKNQSLSSTAKLALGAIKTISVRHTYGNNLSMFSNADLNNHLGIGKCANKQMYSKLLELYTIEAGEEYNPIKDFQLMKYREMIYPKETYTFNSEIRGRKKYYNYYWKNARSARNEENVLNSQGYIILSQSIWGLDARNNFENANCQTGSYGGEGELQNNYTTFFGSNPNQNFDPNLMGNRNPYVVAFNTSSVVMSYANYKDAIVISASQGNLDTWDYLAGNTRGNKVGTISISAWIRWWAPTTPADKQTIIEFGNGERSFYLTTGSAVNKRRLAFSASFPGVQHAGDSNEWCTYTIADGGTELSNHTWYHVGVSFDPRETVANADKAKLFVNGVEYPTYSPTLISDIVADISFNFATIASGTHEISPYSGFISDVAVFTGSFSAAEMLEIYNSGVPTSLYRHSRKNSLISWWRLGGGEGLVTGSGDAGALVNEYVGGAYIGKDCLSASYKEDPRNRIYDMAGTNYGTPIGIGTSIPTAHWSMNSTCLVPLGDYNTYYPYTTHQLSGSIDVPRSNGFANQFKVGTLYSRRTREYVSDPYPTFTISSSQGVRYIRESGSCVFAGDTKWTAEEESSRKPFYETYDKYSEDIRLVGKDYSIVPEFRISEHMDTYLDDNYGNFLIENKGFLTITGSTYENSENSNFFKIYTNSDFLKHFDTIQGDHSEIANITKLKLKCNALLKFIPYKGYYPQDRVLQLSQLFSQSYGKYVKPRGYSIDDSEQTASWRAFLTPFFAPGIVNNSIKAGMAVDWPIYSKESPNTTDDYISGIGGIGQVSGGLQDLALALQYKMITTRGIYGYPLSASVDKHIAFSNGVLECFNWGLTAAQINNDVKAEFETCLCSNFSKRLPFESLVEPENYLAKTTIWDMEPEYSASLRKILYDPNTNQAATWGGQGKLQYKLAMHNFLAATPEYFLDTGKFTSFYSKPIAQEGVVINEQDASNFYGMDIVIANSQCKSLSDWNTRRSLSKYEDLIDDTYAITKEQVDEIKGLHTIMYSRDSAFGPPWVYPHSLFTSSENLYRYHYSYEPFTPAYFNGFGMARLLFYPFRGASLYTLDDIQSHLTMSYVRLPTTRTGSAGVSITNALMEYTTIAGLDKNMFVSGDSEGVYRNSDLVQVCDLAAKNWQQLSASVNLLGKVKVKNVAYVKGIVEDYDPVSYQDDVTAPLIWVIQPKWETPILNFYNEVTTSTLINQGVNSPSKGMWHQYGDHCSDSEGITLGIYDLPATSLNTKVPTIEESANKFPHTYVFQNRAEDEINLENTNASVTLYIRDYTSLGTKYLTIDGVVLTEAAEWVAATDNYKTATNIAIAINSSDETLYSSPIGTQLRHRVKAQAYIPETYPWIDNLGTTTTAPVAAVSIVIRDIATTSSHENYGDSELYSSDLNSPYYYASGELGNKKMASIDSSVASTVWALEGGTYSGEKWVGNSVYFKGGVTRKYKAKSLADLVGFGKGSKKMGNIADEKTIREAIVAVPFIESGKRKKYFRIPRRVIDIATGTKQLANDNEIPGSSIKQMVELMKKYVFPPKMDFVKNKRLFPFVMYIFEFEHKLSKDDLRAIWQNVSPEITTSFESNEVILEHSLLKNELLGGRFVGNMRWMVFKVKEKMPWNYFDKTADSSDDNRFKFDQLKENNGIPLYSYNWPADYCSLIELVKIEMGIEFGKKGS